MSNTAVFFSVNLDDQNVVSQCIWTCELIVDFIELGIELLTELASFGEELNKDVLVFASNIVKHLLSVLRCFDFIPPKSF